MGLYDDAASGEFCGGRSSDREVTVRMVDDITKTSRPSILVIPWDAANIIKQHPQHNQFQCCVVNNRLIAARSLGMI